ncbi:MAG: cytidylate kinase-like family protein [Fimbriimonadaceae bacterium]|nr:cytidylate kinase-like family protein [Fimbriimonadaceae bacterium]
MNRLTGERAAHLVERQMAMFHVKQRAAAAQPEATAPPPAAAGPYVAISRQYGAQGSAVAAAVAERLGYALYDRELVEAVAKDAHLQQRLIEPLDETARSDLNHWIHALLTENDLSGGQYNAALFHVLASLAAVGRAVIVGRGAHLALPADRGLRVRLYAPPEDRLRNVIAEEGLPEKAAQRKLREVEESRQRWLREAFGERAKEPFAFDLALNTATLPRATCVDLILAALRARCPGSFQTG